jgi:hypothetical protein
VDSAKYFTFIKKCRELMGKTSGENDADDFLQMVNDVSWFGCYDDGLTPEQAVKEYGQKRLD